MQFVLFWKEEGRGKGIFLFLVHIHCRYDMVELEQYSSVLRTFSASLLIVFLLFAMTFYSQLTVTLVRPPHSLIFFFLIGGN